MTDTTGVTQEHLALAQNVHEATQRLIVELRDQAVQPADLRMVVLSAAAPVVTLQGSGASIGVLNPTDVGVLLGIGGGSAKPGARGIPVAAQSLVVLPVGVSNVEIGVDTADPDLGADTVVVYVFLYPTVQPAFLGSA